MKVSFWKKLILKHLLSIILQSGKFELYKSDFYYISNRAVEEGGGCKGAEPPLCNFKGGWAPPSTFYKQYIPQLKGLFQE